MFPENNNILQKFTRFINKWRKDCCSTTKYGTHPSVTAIHQASNRLSWLINHRSTHGERVDTRAAGAEWPVDEILWLLLVIVEPDELIDPTKFVDGPVPARIATIKIHSVSKPRSNKLYSVVLELGEYSLSSFSESTVEFCVNSEIADWTTVAISFWKKIVFGE